MNIEKQIKKIVCEYRLTIHGWSTPSFNSCSIGYYKKCNNPKEWENCNKYILYKKMGVGIYQL